MSQIVATYAYIMHIMLFLCVPVLDDSRFIEIKTFKYL